MQVVLSLFPGADLFGMAFEREGFCVVRGPDSLLGGDVRGWHVPPGVFDGVIGGPPCKCFSRSITEGRKRREEGAPLEGNLIPEFERIVCEAEPRWWVMENVKQAPTPFDSMGMKVYWFVADAHAFGAYQHRTRRFSSNLDIAPLLKAQMIPPDTRHSDPWPTVTATEYKCSPGSGERAMRQRAGRKVGRRMTLEEVNVAMGLPPSWQTPALTAAQSYAVRGNGVPLQMGCAVARAVARASAELPRKQQEAETVY